MFIVAWLWGVFNAETRRRRGSQRKLPLFERSSKYQEEKSIKKKKRNKEKNNGTFFFFIDFSSWYLLRKRAIS